MTKLEIRKYPKFVEEFARENFNLKTLTGVLIALMFLESGIVALLLKKGPVVIPLLSDGTIGTYDTGVTQGQVKSAVETYLSSRYAWSPDTIDAQLKKAEFLISPALLKSFEKAMLETKKYVREKKITERVYARHVSIDFKNNVVQVAADRFTAFDGLKAATEMNLTLNFDIGERTVQNPWGVYITKETER